MAQSYSSHAHHPVPTYFAGLFSIVAIVQLVGAWGFGWPTLPAGCVSLSLAVLTLVSISRGYIVRLQDRIIRLEMLVRVRDLLGAGAVAELNSLATKQIVALRFASDEELGALLSRAASEKLPPDEIKKAVKNWRSDDLRT
jgi:hypothetical protein